MRAYLLMIFGLIIVLTTSGNLDVNFPKLGLDGFPGVTVTVDRSGGPPLPAGSVSNHDLVHLHLHDLPDDIPEQVLHGGQNVGGAGKVLTLYILLQ